MWSNKKHYYPPKERPSVYRIEQEGRVLAALEGYFGEKIDPDMKHFVFEKIAESSDKNELLIVEQMTQPWMRARLREIHPEYFSRKNRAK